MKSGAVLCSDCRPGKLRLVGRSGVGFYIRSSVITSKSGKPRLCADVAILTPADWVCVLQQPVAPGLGGRLAEFLTAAALGEAHLREDSLGLQLDAKPDGDDVTVRISTFSEPEPRAVSMATTSAALTRASRDALSLELAQSEES